MASSAPADPAILLVLGKAAPTEDPMLSNSALSEMTLRESSKTPPQSPQEADMQDTGLKNSVPEMARTPEAHPSVAGQQTTMLQ